MVSAGLVAINSSKSGALIPTTPSAMALVIRALIFGASVFCQFQFQRRLHVTRTMQNTDLDRLHDVLAPELPILTGKAAPGVQIQCRKATIGDETNRNDSPTTDIQQNQKII